MKLDITPVHFEEIIKSSYSLDILYMLNLVNANFDVKPLCESSLKIKAIFNTLLRKNLVTNEQKLTKSGLELLDFVSKKTNKKIIKKIIINKDFDEWWLVFPSTDIFTIGNKKFEGSRSMRVNKEKCRLAFTKILLEGEYSVDDIIRATTYDVNLKKNLSLKKASNQLTYMQNSLTYLNQKSFENFVSISKNIQNFTFKTPTGSTDI